MWLEKRGKKEERFKLLSSKGQGNKMNTELKFRVKKYRDRMCLEEDFSL